MTTHPPPLERLRPRAVALLRAAGWRKADIDLVLPRQPWPKRHPPFWMQSIQRQALAVLRAEFPGYQAGIVLRISRNTIKAWSKLPVPGPDVIATPPKRTMQSKHRRLVRLLKPDPLALLKLADDGVTPKQIAAYCGVHPMSARRWLRQARELIGRAT